MITINTDKLDAIAEDAASQVLALIQDPSRKWSPKEIDALANIAGALRSTLAGHREAYSADDVIQWRPVENHFGANDHAVTVVAAHPSYLPSGWQPLDSEERESLAHSLTLVGEIPKRPRTKHNIVATVAVDPEGREVPVVVAIRW